MNIQEVIRKAKALLSFVKLSQETLTDGSTIQYDGEAITVGSVIYLQDEAGEWSVLPDGQYETSSGFKFSIKDGSVDAVDSAEAAPEVVEEAVPQAQSEEPTEEKPEVNPFDEKIAAIWQAIEEIKSSLTASIEASTQTQTALSKVADTVLILSKQPAAEPIEKEVNPFNKSPKEITDSKRYKILTAK